MAGNGSPPAPLRTVTNTKHDSRDFSHLLRPKMCIPRLRVDTLATQLEPSPDAPGVPAQRAGLCASLVESMSPPPPEAEIYGTSSLPGSSGRCLANPVYSPVQGGGSGTRPAPPQTPSSRQSPSETRVPSGLPPRGVVARVAGKAKSATPLALARRRRTSVAVRPQRYGDYFTGDDGDLDDCLEAFEAQGAGGKKGKKGELDEEWEPAPEPVAEPAAELAERGAEDEVDVVKAVHAAAQNLQREMDGVVMQVGEAEETEGPSLKEKLAASWDGKSYYDRLAAMAGDESSSPSATLPDQPAFPLLQPPPSNTPLSQARRQSLLIAGPGRQRRADCFAELSQSLKELQVTTRGRRSSIGVVKRAAEQRRQQSASREDLGAASPAAASAGALRTTFAPAPTSAVGSPVPLVRPSALQRPTPVTSRLARPAAPRPVFASPARVLGARAGAGTSAVSSPAAAATPPSALRVARRATAAPRASSRLLQLKDSRRAARQEVGGAEERLAAAEAANRALQSEIERLRGEAGAESRGGEMKNKLNSLEITIRTLQSGLSSAEAHLSALLAEAASVRSNLRQARGQLSELQAGLLELKRAL